MGTEAVIEVEGLRKTYGSTVAVDGLSFEVRRGEIFGLLGPNGAGKTTTMECVEGLRRPDSGRVRVLSLDPWRQARALESRIGVQLQQAELQKRIKVWEAVDLWSSLHERTLDGEALLERLGLASKRNAWFMTLSGGQKQRLSIALALINEPELVFLDELTTGLDPQARRAIWTMVTDIRERGKTVFLTTHLMEEAERLCDRVAIVEHGRLIETGTPDELVRRHCPQRAVVFTAAPDARLDGLEALEGSVEVTRSNGSVTVEGEGEGFVTEVLRFLAERRVRVIDLRTVHPNLEDVFLELTGSRIRE